jgi:protein ImuB
VTLLRTLPPLAELPASLQRLGIATLGELAALPAAAVGDRFGSLGLAAHRLASGHDRALRPRTPRVPVEAELVLPEAIDGFGLEHAVGVLVDRLLASPLRHERPLRAVTLSALLVEGGGTWYTRMVFREALSDPLRIRLALSSRLREIPAPAQALRLAVTDFGPAAAAQQALIGDPATLRAQRLHEAVQQVRTVAGIDGALRVLPIDPGSRLPERRAVLTPFER